MLGTSNAINLTFEFGTQIRPTEKHAQKILAIKINVRISGTFTLVKTPLKGKRKEIMVIITLVFFSTTMTLSSYHLK